VELQSIVVETLEKYKKNVSKCVVYEKIIVQHLCKRDENVPPFLLVLTYNDIT